MFLVLKNHLTETILLSTNNIKIGGEKNNIILNYTLMSGALAVYRALNVTGQSYITPCFSILRPDKTQTTMLSYRD